MFPANPKNIFLCEIALLLTVIVIPLSAADQIETQSMIRPVPEAGWQARALFTVGDTINEYQPPGVLDGMAAWELDAKTVRVLINHELSARGGYPYSLANGTQLTGARVSYFDIDTETLELISAGLAYDTVYDRRGEIVDHPEQINERPTPDSRGFDVLCSAAGYSAGEFGFTDDLYFTHEEAPSRNMHPHGGSIWALDVKGRAIRALPELGRGAWENLTAIRTLDGDDADGHIALLLSDDLEFGGAPFYLWIGRKIPGDNTLARNGLSEGRLHVWVTDNDDRSPEDWHGTGATRTGHFVEISAHDQKKSGQKGYDPAGYLDDNTLRESAKALGAFMFSRPEDLDTDPDDPTRVIFASTGHGERFPSDDWGALYLFHIEFDKTPAGNLHARAMGTIIHDGDDYGDFGIRSPDNIVWATDGKAYVQEDKSTIINPFGKQSGREASIWQIDPDQPMNFTRIAEIDRSVLLPEGVTDHKAGTVGEWESSGIIDVTREFGAAKNQTLLLATVQAHTIRDGAIGGRRKLVQGGQLILLTGPRPVVTDTRSD